MSTMIAMLQDPVQCGYLLRYCQARHNSENLCLMMMVSRLRDALAADSDAWTSPGSSWMRSFR